jgi:Core-2/I-Branching enzyme
MSVRIAVMVLAYGYPAGISAMSKFFDAADTDMFVHVDAKIDYGPFQDAAKCGLRKVAFIEDRTRIFWRGFTMVEATIALLRAARASGGFDRYLIISDDSLPLVGPGELRRRLEIDGDFITASAPSRSY